MAKRDFKLLALAGLLAAACGGSGGAAPQGSAAPAATVHVGFLGSVSDGGLVIANDFGYFKEENLTIEFQRFQSAANMTPPLGTGQLDVGAGAPSAGLFNAMARDIKLRIVADKGDSEPGFGYEQYIVRQQEAASIKGPADLKGKTVAIAALGIPPQRELDDYLRKGGLTVKDVKIQTLAFPDMVTALANGSVDMAAPIEPFGTLAISKGVGTLLARTSDFDPDHQLGVVLYSEQFAKQTDVARRFMRAYLRGVRDYADVFIKKRASADKRSRVIQVLIKNTSVTDPTLYDKMVVPYLDPNGAVRKASLASDQDWFVQYGGQKDKVDMAKAIDESFVSWAVQKLGTYK